MADTDTLNLNLNSLFCSFYKIKALKLFFPAMETRNRLVVLNFNRYVSMLTFYFDLSIHTIHAHE